MDKKILSPNFEIIAGIYIDNSQIFDGKSEK